MYIHVCTSECTYHVRHVYMYICRNVNTCMYMSMVFTTCIYHVYQLMYCSIVHTLYIHGTDVSVHVYARRSGFQMICHSHGTSHRDSDGDRRRQWATRSRGPSDSVRVGLGPRATAGRGSGGPGAVAPPPSYFKNKFHSVFRISFKVVQA